MRTYSRYLRIHSSSISDNALRDWTLIKIVVAHYVVTRCSLNIHSNGSTKYTYRVLRNFHDFIKKIIILYLKK